jgi:anti-sigma-K factor RskA
MTCREVDETLSAYSLDALPADEAASVTEHLRGCRRHDVALGEFRAVVARLPLVAEEREPPAGLRERVLGALDVEESRQAPGSAGRPLAFRPGVAYAAAAVLVLALAGFLAWGLVTQFGAEGDQAQVVAAFEGEGSGQVVYLEDEHTGTVELELPGLSPGQSYQAWAIFESGPASLGVIEDPADFSFEHDLTGATAVAVSVEPEGGSEQPTSEPLAVATLP